jgi:hypothetical protein
MNNLAIEYVKLASLAPYAKNARTHSREQISQIAASIREFGFNNPILVDGNKGIVAGHGRALAALELELDRVPVIELKHLSEAQKRAYIIADNQLAMNAGWDFELLSLEIKDLEAQDFNLDLLGFNPTDLSYLLNPTADEPESASTDTSKAGSLNTQFMISPFSVLNAREGWWQDRKRAWINLGIRSEIGRGENALSMSAAANEQMRGGHVYKEREKRAALAAQGGIDSAAGREEGLTYGNSPQITEQGLNYYRNKKKSAVPGGGGGGGYLKKGANGYERAQPGYGGTTGGLTFGGFSENFKVPTSGTSIFDPVMCELAYRWFSPPTGLVLDPFSGGSVRGIVASRLGRSYYGIDLRAEQIAANQEQALAVCPVLPQWICGDSTDPKSYSLMTEKADFIFSCPPYADLEVYSDDPKDISTMDYPAFKQAYFAIIKEACSHLKDDRFACFVVGEVRGKDKNGAYYNFVGDTVEAFRAAGLDFYNEAILITMVGSLPIRAAKQFSASRKLGKTHQNVLVFVKGDVKKATLACGQVVVDPSLFDNLPVDPEDGEAVEESVKEGVQVKVSAAMARLEFAGCSPDYIKNTCHATCCQSSTSPTGTIITIHPREVPAIEARGGVVIDGLLQPKPGEKKCPFKTQDNLCGIHFTPDKPFGCIASPFTLNDNDTLIVRNRYKTLKCYKDGDKVPAYRAFSASLKLIFGEEGAARITAHLDAGGGDILATMSAQNYETLKTNDVIKKG